MCIKWKSEFVSWKQIITSIVGYMMFCQFTIYTPSAPQPWIENNFDRAICDCQYYIYRMRAIQVLFRWIQAILSWFVLQSLILMAQTKEVVSRLDIQTQIPMTLLIQLIYIYICLYANRSLMLKMASGVVKILCNSRCNSKPQWNWPEDSTFL
jgi:hypothetical protein